jgi:membrane protease YdiL (CAAX protease family)
MQLRAMFRNEADEWRAGWRIAVMFVLLVASVLLINIAWKAAGLPGKSDSGPWTFAFFTALIAGSLAGITVFLLRRFEQRGLAAVGLALQHSAWKMTAAGALLGSLPVCLLSGVAMVFGYGSVQAGNAGVADLPGIMLPAMLATFLLAAWEELMLRGYLFRQLSLGLNPTAAVLITAALFGLMHAGNPGANWQGLVYTAIGGVFMGLVLLRTGSLWVLIGYHFGWNAMSSSVLGLELSGTESSHSFFVSSLAGPDWLTGGSYGFEASLPAVICETLILGALLLTSRSFGPRSVP